MEKVRDGHFGWGAEGDGVIEMTGTFTRNAIAGVEGIWMRASTQVVTLRFRRVAVGSESPRGECGVTAEGTPIEGTFDWPEEQASAEFSGRIFSEVSSKDADGTEVTAVTALILEGQLGEVIQGSPERVGWLPGAVVRGTFCKDGTDGTIKGSWSAKAPATALEDLGPGGMRINVGLLPDRLVASEVVSPLGGRSGGGGGSACLGGEPVMGSACRWSTLDKTFVLGAVAFH